MHRSSIALSFAAFTLLAGCRTHYSQYYLGSDDYVLASRDGPGDRKESYRLEVRGDNCSLRVATEYERERPFLGLKLTELDKGQAERRGVKPYSGLLVKGVYPKSSAEEGGVLAGDVLLKLDTRETVYLPQVTEIEGVLRSEQMVTAKVLRGQEQLDLPLATKLLKERVTDQEEVPLVVPKHEHRPYAGVTLRGIPAVWCEKIFGTARQAVVVANVQVGSPAWVAGLRGGDVIDTVDGAPVPDVQSLAARIATGGEAGQAMTFGVRRGAGPLHEGAVALEDYSREANAWFPLVFHLQSGTYEDRWSIGPFGLLMSNRNTYIPNTSTRRVQTRNVFNAVLGLFRVETNPEETEVRLLWVIRFDT